MALVPLFSRFFGQNLWIAMLGTTTFYHGPVQPLSYARVLNRFASLCQFLLILIRKCLHCQYAGSDRNIEKIVLR